MMMMFLSWLHKKKHRKEEEEEKSMNLVLMNKISSNLSIVNEKCRYMIQLKKD